MIVRILGAAAGGDFPNGTVIVGAVKRVDRVGQQRSLNHRSRFDRTAGIGF